MAARDTELTTACAISGKVQSGDHEDLAQVLNRVSEDQISAAAEEIEQKLHDASPVDASTYITAISAVAPNLRHLKDSATIVGDACADLLDQSRDEGIPAPVVTERGCADSWGAGWLRVPERGSRPCWNR